MSVPSDSSSSGGVMGAVRIGSAVTIPHREMCLLSPCKEARRLSAAKARSSRARLLDHGASKSGGMSSKVDAPASLLAKSNPQSFLILLSVKGLATAGEGTGGGNARTRFPSFCRLSACQHGWPRDWLPTSSTCRRPSAPLRASTLTTRWLAYQGHE